MRSNGKSSVASALRIFGWIIIIGGLFSGYVLAKPSLYLGGYYGYNDVFLWPIAIGTWFGSALSGALILGFAEVLDNLKAKSSIFSSDNPKNMSENTDISLIESNIEKERIYKNALAIIDSSNDVIKLNEVKRELNQISNYRNVVDILEEIDSRIKTISIEKISSQTMTNQLLLDKPKDIYDKDVQIVIKEGKYFYLSDHQFS